MASKHGLASRSGKHPLYSAWQGMMTRCYNKNYHAWVRYGGRGIKVCARWHSVEKFAEDMMSTWSKGLTLDRIDNSKDYEPGNCRWTTKKVQSVNRDHVTIVATPSGDLPFKDAVAKYGQVTYSAACYRLRKGMDPWEAIITPPKKDQSFRKG